MEIYFGRSAKNMAKKAMKLHHEEGISLKKAWKIVKSEMSPKKRKCPKTCKKCKSLKCPKSCKKCKTCNKCKSPKKRKSPKKC